MSQTEVQLIKDAVIVNADISNSAAIDVSKISGVMPLAGGTFTNDVTFDGETAGRDIIFDRSANALEFADNAKAMFGSGDDLQIYHDGSNSFIKEDGTGNLYIFSANLRIENADGSKSYIEANDGGAVELYNDNARKLKTNSTGFQVGTTSARLLIENLTSGDGSQDIARVGLNRDNNSTSDRQLWSQVTVAPTVAKFNVFARSANDTGTAGNYLEIDAPNNNFDLPRDNLKLRLGSGNDLQIYHDGNSKIQNVNNSCDFRLISNSIELKSQSGDEFFQKCTVDGAVELYHDNGKVFTTESNGVQVLANEGLSAFLRIYADQGDDNADLYWLKTEQDGTGFYIQNNVSGSTETNFRTVGNGATELFHDNSKKLETLSDGVNVTGTLKVNGSAFSGGIASVVEDTSPQLGGHLDSNGFNVAISTGEKLTFAASSGAGPEIYNAGSSSRDLRINIDNDHKYTLHQNGILYQEGANSSNGGAYTSPQPSYPVRVWLSFNDEDNITNGVGGVSSVTDTGTGTFTINFGTSFPDDNYAFTATSGGQSGSRGDDTCITHGTTNPGTGSVSIRTRKFTDNNFTNLESAMFIFVR